MQESGIGINRGLVDVTPDVRLLSVLRATGVNLNTAIGEILDNSIDAGANEIDLYVYNNDRKKSNIMIVDNGKGMNDATLRGSLTLAKELKLGINQLGKYGMGMKTAALSLSTQFEIFTQKASGEVLYGEYNINKMEQLGQFKTTVRLANEEETSFFKSKLGRRQRSGTIIIIKNADRLDITHQTFVRQMQSFIGLTYKNFINRGIAFTVNDVPAKGDKIEAIDVLMRENKKTFVVAERDHYVVEYNAPKINQVKNTSIEVSATVLPKPDHNSKGKKIDGKDVQLPLNQTNQGIYFYREGRMVGQALNWHNVFGEKHNEKNRFRIEINCKSELDQEINMNFLKGNVYPTIQLKNQLSEIIEPYMAEMREKLHLEEKKELAAKAKKIASGLQKQRKIEMVIPGTAVNGKQRPTSVDKVKVGSKIDRTIDNKAVSKTVDTKGNSKSKNTVRDIKKLLVAAKEIRKLLEAKEVSEEVKNELRAELGLAVAELQTV
ncbi:ATP-binding protein [Priestia megaterium]|uniref:ATP-binding protein n=1 Tax=Priestia megaterium TaxID=1404 RepID=A0A6M6DYR4_PRIMG|nr:ATP-binding protein [Priestia megaterium]QJX79912.1 hypothetical protein FDZ14_27815 [Priestia megaterium]